MMVRGLVDEVVRRRLWPIPLLALLIAIAAPVLFMKSAPADGAGATAVPPAAAPGKLPATAEKLLVTDDKSAAPKSTKKHKRQDPFAPPAGTVKEAAAVSQTDPTGAGVATAAPQVSSAGASAPPVTPPASTAPTSSGSTPSTEPSTSSPKVTTTKPASEPKKTTPKVTTPTAPATRKVTYVDVRFGPRMGTMLRPRIPRLQTFRAAGKVAAMYVGYSRARRVAVFAIAPTTKVEGDVKCRTVNSVCRFVDLAPNSYARLTLHDDDGAKVSRRLDVVAVRRVTETGRAKTAPLATSLLAANCLMKRLLALPATAPSISTDSCD